MLCYVDCVGLPTFSPGDQSRGGNLNGYKYPSSFFVLICITIVRTSLCTCHFFLAEMGLVPPRPQKPVHYRLSRPRTTNEIQLVYFVYLSLDPEYTHTHKHKTKNKNKTADLKYSTVHQPLTKTKTKTKT